MARMPKRKFWLKEGNMYRGVPIALPALFFAWNLSSPCPSPLADPASLQLQQKSGLLSRTETTPFSRFAASRPSAILARLASTKRVARDNVVFECGLFMGAVGKERLVNWIPDAEAAIATMSTEVHL